MASLALWMNFWNWEGNPVSVSATAVAVGVSPYTTGGARGNRRADNTYQMLPDDYWDVREMTLAKGVKPREEEAPAYKPPPSPARLAALAELRNAPDLNALKALATKLRDVP